MTSTKANFLLLGIAVLWGVSFTLVKDILGDIGPSSFIAWRFLLGSLFLLALFPRRASRLTRPMIAAGFLIGVTNGVGFVVQTIGLQYTTAGKAGFITGLYIIFVPLLSYPILGERVRLGQWIGVLTAAGGMALLCVGAGFTIGRGDLWVLGCAGLFALQVLFVSRYAPHYDPIPLTLVQLVVVAVVAWIPAAAVESPLSAYPARVWGVVLFTAVFPTLGAFLIQTWAQPKTSATAAALIMSLEAVFAAFFGWIMGGEHLTAKEIAGCALMLVGMGLVEWRPRSRREPVIATG